MSSLEGVIRAAIHHSPDGGDSKAKGLRPVLLTTHLGLDKSLASRVVRSIAAECELRALQGIPTPQGLALIAGAARDRGVSPAHLGELERATDRYGELLAEFSGGRTDLDAALAGWIPEQRKRAERDARRSVFRGMTTLSGTRTSAVYNAVFLTPSAHDGRIDSVHVALRQDLRRLRSGARLHLASLTANPGALDSRQTCIALDGSPLWDDPSRLILEELCSHPIPKLEVEDFGESQHVALHRDALDVNEFATVGLAWRHVAQFPNPATPGAGFLKLTAAASIPTEALVMDVLVHHSLDLEPDPTVTVYREGVRLGGRGPGAPAPADSPDRQLAPRLIPLDGHPSGLASSDVRSAAAIAENVCREAGLDLSEYSKGRLRVAFPLPVEELNLWWSLPSRDGSPP